ncbi:hypothetical protein GMMP15_500008 [Candidatus Magnetomoraceae bacterium gMMP-15]
MKIMKKRRWANALYCIYTKKNKNTYLFTPSGKNNEAVLTKLRKNFGELEKIKEIDIKINTPLIVTEPEKIIADIQKKGFHIHKT